MDVHTPKPVHSLRELAREIGVIVIGVLIALAGEQAVEALRWRAEVADARKSLDRQAEQHLFNASERLGFLDCESRQLDRMAEIVSQPGPTPRIWGRIEVPFRGWTTSAWDAAVASGVVAHMRADVRQAYAQHFGSIPTFGALNQQEILLASDLHSLGAPTVLTDTSRDRLASDVARLQGLGRLTRLGARYMVGELRGMGIDMTPEHQARLKQELSKPCLMPDQVQPPD
jgi:hypothetical protein